VDDPTVNLPDSLDPTHPSILAWDSSPGRSMAELSYFSLATGGISCVHSQLFRPEQVADITRTYGEQGLRVGSWAPPARVVWLEEHGNVTVWTWLNKRLHTEPDHLCLSALRHEKQLFAAIVAFTRRENIYTGLQGQCHDGRVLTLVEHRSRTAARDPTYGRHELLIDSTWTGILGPLLARWASVPFRSEI